MKALLQYVINCRLLCIVPVINSATICRTTLPAGARKAVAGSWEDCSRWGSRPPLSQPGHSSLARLYDDET